jgi:ribonuclease J
MVNVSRVAMSIGELQIPEEYLIDMDILDQYPDNEILVMTTGSQGEPMAGLTRMAYAEHRKLQIRQSDMVIISATPIPGNEKFISRVINQLYRLGAQVVYSAMAEVHVSGHACQEELKLLHALIRPKYFIPVHGEARHLKMHADLAKEMGVLPERVFIAHNGAVVELSARKGVMNETVQAGTLMVDGLQNIEDAVLRDRKTLSADGLVSAVIVLDAETGRLLAPVELYSRGFIYMRDNEPLIQEASALVYETAKRFEEANKGEYPNVKSTVKSRLKSFLYDKTGRTPMILPIVIEI